MSRLRLTGPLRHLRAAIERHHALGAELERHLVGYLSHAQVIQDAIEMAVAEARAEEDERIARWLCEYASDVEQDGVLLQEAGDARMFAAWIREGDHLKGGSE